VAFVTSVYVPLLRIRILEGRSFDATEDGRDDVVVVGEGVARTYFTGGSAIGQRIRLGSGASWRTIIGVAADVPAQGLATTGGSPQMHMPRTEESPEEILLLRTSRDGAAVRAALAAAAVRIDAEVEAPRVETVSALLAASLERPRFNLLLMATFAVLAVVLAAIGLYGVVAHAVGQRRREIGIRRALGARDEGIVAMVVKQGMRPVAIGIVIGLAAAAMLGRLMESLIFGLDPLDPVTFIVVPALLATVAVIACLLPARRAAAVEPLAALRTDA
jgi:putative ABC transport system permease protein